MMADKSVRRATIADATAVGEVQSVVFREVYAGRVDEQALGYFEPSVFADAWRTSLASPPPGVYALFVALAGNEVVGVAAVGPSQDPDAEGTWAEINLLAVHPAQRRAGHGSRLLNACADHLREAGADEVSLWLPADDEKSRAFVTASGFLPDAAYRDREVSPDGRALREVRLRAALRAGDD